jgi:hypothetical protein
MHFILQCVLVVIEMHVKVEKLWLHLLHYSCIAPISAQ